MAQERLVGFGQDFGREILLHQLGRNDQSLRDRLNDVSPAKKNGWEPFLQEPAPNHRFINLYNGLFETQMELARTKVDELIRVAAIDGNVVLTTMSVSRTRSLDANQDGSVTSKRRLLWGEKLQDEDRSKPVRVTSMPEGWKIEIADQVILQELMEKEGKKSLANRYAAEMQHLVHSALQEIVLREKLSFEKDGWAGHKCFLIGFALGSSIVMTPIYGFQYRDPLQIIFVTVICYGCGNSLNRLFDKMFVTNTSRNLTSTYEYLMPPVEIDRVARGLLYLNLKGRNLVRLAPDQGSK